LSEQILRLHATAEVTVTDLDPTSVRNIAAGELGDNPRVTTKVVDATAIDEPDRKYDLVVFAASFHHLSPKVAYRAIAEATRVGNKFLVVDGNRPPPVVLMLLPLLMLPMALFIRPLAAARAMMHDSFISGLRLYSALAFTALGRAAEPEMRTEFLGPQSRLPLAIAVVYSRPRANRGDRSADCRSLSQYARA
jgi:SAM-dependent methyltransferase